MEGETHPHAHGHLEEAQAVPRDLWFLRSGDLDTLHHAGRLFAGQTASRPPSASRLRCFDLLLTSFPPFVERFRRDGVDAEYFPIALYERVLDRLGERRVDPRSSLFGSPVQAYVRRECRPPRPTAVASDCSSG